MRDAGRRDRDSAALAARIATISFQSMMADATDEHEHLFGARREGLYFAGITFSAKASSGLGAWIGGIALDVIGFPHGVTNPALLARIPAETIRNLGIAYGPGASIFTAVAVAVLMTYKLTKADHARIQTDLKNWSARCPTTAARATGGATRSCCSRCCRSSWRSACCSRCRWA